MYQCSHFAGDVDGVLHDLTSCLLRSAIEVKPTMHDLIEEAMHKHAHDFDD